VESAEVTVTITVTGVNDPPAAGADSYTTAEDTALTIAAPGVLANDVDPEGDALQAVVLGGPLNGTLALNADGSFTYTPNADFTGADSFTYTVSDGEATAKGTVTITVTAVNDAPSAAADAFSTNEDTTLTVGAPGVLANDTDVDSATRTGQVESQPGNGTVSRR
jgi:VCBS repeat-containing protein